jgi:limonene-1,2-epoxide hydrolase
MTMSVVDIFRFQDGKIAELWHYVPVPDILEQIAAPAQTAAPTSGVRVLEGVADQVAIVKAFYDAMSNLEYEKAISYFADDVVTINPSGTYTGTEANLAQYREAWEAGIRIEVSSLRNVGGIVVYHVRVFDKGNLIVEGDGGITIVEGGEITFDGSTSDMPPMEDPTSPIAVIKAFYIALNAREYDKAMTFVADDATLTDDGGSYQGKDEIAARISEAGSEGRSYDIWEISEVDGTVTYQAKVYQADTVIYEALGSNVVKDGKITLTSMAQQ